MTLRIVEDNPASPRLADLIALHVRESSATAPPENRHVLGAKQLADATITFWTARNCDEIVGMIALKQLDPVHGEIKSMRTAPGHLRKGVARQLLDHALAEALTRGYRRVSLETGTHPHFIPANALYEAAGFIDGPAFGGYPASSHNRFMTLEL